MARPRVLWIGCKRWRVRYQQRITPGKADEGATKYYAGECDFKRRRITVNPHAPDHVHNLLHEVIHAAWFEAGYEVHGERRINTAVWAILESLRGNPHLVDLLLSSIPSHKGGA